MIKHLIARYARISISTVTAISVACSSLFLVTARAYASACTPPSTDYGTVTSTVNIPAAATYRAWSRMQVPDTTNNTYLLEIDGTTCFNVGGGTSIPTGGWTWVAFKDGTTSSRTDLSLTQGTHNLKFIGNKPGVKLDRVFFTSDLNCTPTDTTGDMCNVPVDTTLPSVTLTAPASGAKVSGNTTLTATATDNIGVTKVEFYIDSTLVSTKTASPYSTTWDSTTATNDIHRLTAKAYDAAGNVGSANYNITVQNGDNTAPTTPTAVGATATAYNTVKVQWTASTDDTGVTGYTVSRDGVPVTNVTSGTTFTDTGLNPQTTYQYRVNAYDAAGNKSAASPAVSVTTPSVPDTTAPSAPANLSGTSVSTSQINLAWTASTDNIGVAAYDVYRSTGTSTATKVATVTTPSFGDTNLTADTTYSYFVKARDSAGNVSSASNTIQVKTQPVSQPGSQVVSVRGKITSQSTGKPIPWAVVTMRVGSKSRIYQADSYGNYYINNLPVGQYTLNYRAYRYYTHTETIYINANIVKDVSLERK